MASRSRLRDNSSDTLMNAWSALSAETHCAQASADLCVASRDADEEKSDQAAAWRLHRDSGVDGRPRCSGREESATGDWISDADVASRFATNTRVRSEPFAVFVDKCAAIPTSRRDGIFYHVRPSVSVTVRECLPWMCRCGGSREPSATQLPVAPDNAGRLKGGL